MVLVMLALNVTMTWTGIIRCESPRKAAFTYVPEYRVAPTLRICVELTDIIVQPCDSDPSFQIVKYFYLNARWKVNKYEVNPILAMKACGGMNCSSIHCFLTSELDVIEWSSPCFEKRALQYPLITRLFSPHRRSFWRKISCPFRKSNRKRARSDSNFSTFQIASQGAYINFESE